MPSLQLLQLTEHGRNFVASKRRTLAAVSTLALAGGTIAYLRSQNQSSFPFIPKSCDLISPNEDFNVLKQNGAADGSVNIARKKRNKLRSLHALVAILLYRMGPMGVRNLVALLTSVILRTTLSNRLARLQGLLFQSAFLLRVPSFLRLMIENFLLCFLQSTLHSTSKYLTGSLSLRFRQILTDLVHADYFENIVYYKISHVDNRINNPEQRITSDIPKFCSELSELIQDDLTAVADGLLYTWRLCSYASPKYVLWILAYVTGAGALIRYLSPDFGKLTSKEQQLEGDYRQLHSRLRTHSESIAFYGGENREASHLKDKFKELVRHSNIVQHDHWWFGIIQDFLFKYLNATVAVVLTIEPFFLGNLRPEASTLGRAEMLNNIRYHTSVIKSLFDSLGTLAISSRRLNSLSGFSDRINELMVVARELAATSVNSLSSQNVVGKELNSDVNYIKFEGVKVVTPTGNVLVDGLDLKLEFGSNLLITGPNGSGKSSLFRVLGGLWPLVSGSIIKPGVGSDLNKEIFYVPQRPYTVVGTLYDQLIYPLTRDQENEQLTCEEMIELLRNVDLEYLLDRYPLDKEVNWGDELSLGEQQRLGMARLFYHKPKFAILDECTSAVTTEIEERFCAKLRSMGISCITISHRPALVAFHDIILSLDGEGGWSVQHKRDGPTFPVGVGDVDSKSSPTTRHNDALTVQRAFAAIDKGSAQLNVHSYSMETIASSPDIEAEVPLPTVMQVKNSPRKLHQRATALIKILIPSLLDKQTAMLLAIGPLVISRTWISDSIALLNGTIVKCVLEQDKAAIVKLIGTSILQSAANSTVSSSLRHLTARISIIWRISLTRHLFKTYLLNNAFYKVFHMSGKNIDADQRITYDVGKLTSELSGLATGMVKPSVDILWFTWRMKLLTGQRGVALLYTYMLLGLGFLRSITPDFGELASKEQELEGKFRFVHSRLRTHAESIAFFGGGSREKTMVNSRFKELLDHSKAQLRSKWAYGIFDEFVTKQLPHNVTWGLSLLYALDHKDDQEMASKQGELAHALRFLASVVSQSFSAFGDILKLHKKFLQLSGGVNRVFELNELLDAAQSEATSPSASLCSGENNVQDVISFFKVDIVTPSRKLLARELTCNILHGDSLLITGPNGSGKSSIFRALRGLWPIPCGRIMKPNQGVFFVPQRPYTSLGTLRDQIIYPLSHDEAELKMLLMLRNGGTTDTASFLDASLKKILEAVKLAYLMERGSWDVTLNWEDVLSLGEQQRLGMARLFFHHPRFAILDECTNATSVDVEEHLYRIAKEMGITVITSSQRPALILFHEMELKLIDGNGKWELCKIKQ